MRSGLFFLFSLPSVLGDLVSPWSTEPLHWNTPTNVTIHEFGPSSLDGIPLDFPITHPLLLRVHNGETCAPVDSDDHRYMWWAEVRRHASLEEVLEIGQMHYQDVPVPIRNKLHYDGCSSILYFHVGSSGLDFETAPRDELGMRAFVDWVSTIMRTHCTVQNPLNAHVTLFWVDDTLNEQRVCDVHPEGQVHLLAAVPGHLRPGPTDTRDSFLAGPGTPKHLHRPYLRRKREGNGGCGESCRGGATLTSSLQPSSTIDDPLQVDWWAMDGRSYHFVQNRSLELEQACAFSSTCVDIEQALFNYIYQSSFNKRHALNTVQPWVRVLPLSSRSRPQCCPAVPLSSDLPLRDVRAHGEMCVGHPGGAQL